MSVSNLSFSASIPPFARTTGFVSNSSTTNLAATGNLSVTNTTDPSTGQKSSTVTSSLLSNGIAFVSNGSSQSGDLLTVNYVSTNAADSGTDSGITSELLKTNISGTGISFVEDSSTTHDGTGRATYSTSPNSAYTATVQNAAISSETGDTAENILLRSFSQVGNSISITYQVSNGSLSNNTVLAHAQVPEQTPSADNSPPISDSGQAPTFSTTGYATIGDLLAASNGIGANGDSGTSLHGPTQSDATGVPQANSVLAAALNPSINPTPSNSPEVADFINANLNAFPTSNSNSGNFSTPANNNAYNAANGFNNSNSGSISPFGSTDSNYSNPGNSPEASGSGSPTIGAVASTGIYSAISNASASTIRGTGVDTLA